MSDETDEKQKTLLPCESNVITKKKRKKNKGKKRKKKGKKRRKKKAKNEIEEATTVRACDDPLACQVSRLFEKFFNKMKVKEWCQACKMLDELRLRLRNCAHIFCGKCILRHIEDSVVRLGLARIRCPCLTDCGRNLHPNDVWAVLLVIFPCLFKRKVFFVVWVYLFKNLFSKTSKFGLHNR